MIRTVSIERSAVGVGDNERRASNTSVGDFSNCSRVRLNTLFAMDIIVAPFYYLYAWKKRNRDNEELLKQITKYTGCDYIRMQEGLNMIDLETYKKNNRVRQNRTVQGWLRKRLIPGVINAPSLEDVRFPNSARSPYRYRSKIKRDTPSVCAHVVNAAVNNEYIDCRMCHIPEIDFNNAIALLLQSDLINVRIEEGVTYYNSTANSEPLSGKHLKEIRQFVLDLSEAVARGATAGALN